MPADEAYSSFLELVAKYKGVGTHWYTHIVWDNLVLRKNGKSTQHVCTYQRRWYISLQWFIFRYYDSRLVVDKKLKIKMLHNNKYEAMKCNATHCQANSSD